MQGYNRLFLSLFILLLIVENLAMHILVLFQQKKEHLVKFFVLLDGYLQIRLHLLYLLF